MSRAHRVVLPGAGALRAGWAHLDGRAGTGEARQAGTHLHRGDCQSARPDDRSEHRAALRSGNPAACRASTRAPVSSRASGPPVCVARRCRKPGQRPGPGNARRIAPYLSLATPERRPSGNLEARPVSQVAAKPRSRKRKIAGKVRGDENSPAMGPRLVSRSLD